MALKHCFRLSFCHGLWVKHDKLPFSPLLSVCSLPRCGVSGNFLWCWGGRAYTEGYLRLVGLLLLVAGSLPIAAEGAQDSLIPVWRTDGATRFASADHLGQVYRITAANGIEKYGSEGQLLSQYTGQREGRADYLDVVNPMKILVWYRDFRSLVILDRNLTMLGSLSMLSAGFPEVRTVASSRDGHLWIYDEVLFRLMKITQEGTVLHESPHVGQWYSRPVSIIWMKELDTRLYAMDQHFGLLVFDAFGQPRVAYPMERRPMTMDVQRDDIWYVEGSDLIMWRPDTGDLQVWPLPNPGVPGSWLISERHLLHVGSEGVSIYPLSGLD
jgi:hypothetical protein